MIRIFHISDFHLNNNLLSDWKDFLKKNFINYVNENKTDNSFIVCSGDMIDKGGKDFGGTAKGLQVFLEEVIQPIIDATGISLDRFILAPGNHDIDRDADEDYVRDGVRNKIRNGGVDKINEYTKKLLNEKGSPSNRVKDYYNFVEGLYKDFDNIQNYYLGTVYKYNVGGAEVAFASFNTAWNCCDDDDKDWGLAIGESQYLACQNSISENAIKIAVMHHPLDWLKYENRSIQAWMRTDYPLLLMGHVHEGDTYLSMTPMGSQIFNLSPSFTNDIRKPSLTYRNGFTAIDYDISGGKADFSYLVYNHKFRKYVLNGDYVENGVFTAKLTDGDSKIVSQLVLRCIGTIKDKYVPEINQSIIPQKAKAIDSLDAAFVMPPLKKNGDLDKTDGYNLSSILNCPNSVLLLGQHESGKTVLLNKILTEFVANESTFGLVPVYYDFTEQSNRDIETIIKNYLECNSKEAETLIEEGKIILLVDNYTPTIENKERSKKLYRFITDNLVRIIATANHEVIDSIPEYIVRNNEIAFEYYFIHQFSSVHIKELITKWTPDIQRNERNKKIESLVARFCSFSLPCTAMQVSLYLWSTENSQRDPVNPSVLLDIYMEIILERMSLEDIYVNTFDYDNKASLLAYLAKSIHDEMKLKPDVPYILSHGRYIIKVEEYVKKVGFKGIDPDKLAQYFIDRKIFILREGNIEFAHACFYYFFLAKRMIKDDDFKNYVLSKEEYYKYDRVIEYYSGLVRSNKSLLDFLYKEVEDVFSTVSSIHDNVDIDSHFTYIREGQKTYTPIIVKVQPDKVVENKPTEDEADKRMLAIADKKLSKISDKFTQPDKISPASLIIMLSRALRNLDGVEDTALKQKVYNSIIKNSVILTAIVKDQLADYANNHNGSLPQVYGKVKNVGLFFRMMPFAMQLTLGEILATRKLVNFFEAKLNQDYKNGASDVEKYLSLGMMWDSTGLDNKKAMSKFISKIGRNSSQDYVLLKLLYNFNMKVALGSEEEDEYIELLASLRGKQKIISILEKEKFKKKMKDSRTLRMIKENKKN